MFCLNWYELSKKETKRYRKSVDYHNELLQLHYSLENLQTLREFKEKENEDYQWSLNDEELQNRLREWRRSKNQQNNNKAFNANDTNLFETIQKLLLSSWK